MTALVIGGHSFLEPLNPYSVSEPGRAILNCVERATHDILSSATLGAPHAEAFRELRSAVAAGRKQNWDGYGGKPVDKEVVEVAALLLYALPTYTPVPEIYPEPDGEICFYWSADELIQLSVSVGSSGRVSWAKRTGSASSSGTDWFDDEVPEAVREGIAQVVRAGTRVGT